MAYKADLSQPDSTHLVERSRVESLSEPPDTDWGAFTCNDLTGQTGLLLATNECELYGTYTYRPDPTKNRAQFCSAARAFTT